MFPLPTPDAAADKILARVVAYHRAHPALSVDFTANPGRGPIVGHMVFDRNVRVLIHMQDPRADYRVRSAPDGVLEVNYTSQTYDEYPGYPNVYLPDSRIAPFGHSIPGWYLANDIRPVFKNIPFNVTGTEQDSGQKCDVVHAHQSSQMGLVDIEAAVDPVGIIRRLKYTVTGMTGSVTVDWRISKVVPVEHPVASQFALDTPLGFVPYALPGFTLLIGTGRQFPSSGWRGAGGGALNVSKSLGARGGLVAFLGPDSEPSTEARASLARLRHSVPVVTLSASTHPLSGTDGYDPSGRLLDRVSAPATPLFLLIDGQGKVTKKWMGYDPTHAPAFEQDIKTSFKG